MQWDQTALSKDGLPLWEQIAQRLRHDIEIGAFKQGETLPSELLLNQVFGVSRTTARAALNKLEQEGLIRRQAGKGSIVLPPQMIQPLNHMSSFAEDMRRRGFIPGYKTLSVRMVFPDEEITKELKIEPGQKALNIIRLLNADDEPMAWSCSWVVGTLFEHHEPPSKTDLDNHSLYDWLETYCSCRISKAKETINAELLTAEMAKKLHVAKASAALVIRRLSYTEENMPVEYVIVHYRSDRYAFGVELIRS